MHVGYKNCLILLHAYIYKNSCDRFMTAIQMSLKNPAERGCRILIPLYAPEPGEHYVKSQLMPAPTKMIGVANKSKSLSA